MPSRSSAPRQSSKLFKMVQAMLESNRLWTYADMSEFGFKQNNARSYDKKNDRGYWSVNIRWAKDSHFIAKNSDGLYYVTSSCKELM